MNKRVAIVLLVCLVLAVTAVLTATVKSTIWDQGFSIENQRKLIPLKSGWSVKESSTFTEDGILTIRRTFDKSETRKIADEICYGYVKDLVDTDNYSVTPTIYFATHNQIVLVYINWGSGDKLVYSYGGNGNIVAGSEGGSAIHAVRLPFNGKDSILVTVQLSPEFTSSNMAFDRMYYNFLGIEIPDFYMGYGAQILQQLIYYTWFQWVPVILLLLISLAMVMYYIVFLTTQKRTVIRYLFFGLFSLGTALVFFFEAAAGNYFFKNSFIPYFLSTLLISCEPVFAMHFLRINNSLNKHSPLLIVFSVVSIVNLFLVCAFAFIKSVPFAFVRVYVCVVFMTASIIKIVLILNEIITERGSVTVYDISVIIAGGCVIADLFISLFSRDKLDLFAFTRWGALPFFGAFGMQATTEFFSGEINKAKSEMLKQTTTYDFLTGVPLGTRAWRDDRTAWGETYGFMIVGVAGFREVRKHFGPNECENVIRMVAQALKNIYPLENILQIAASKFGVFIPLEKMPEIENDIKMLKTAEEDYNNLKLGYTISIETVYSTLDLENDINLEGLYARLLPQLLKKTLVSPKTIDPQVNLL